jgi:hypothetical protein
MGREDGMTPPITPEQRAWIDEMSKTSWGGRPFTEDEARAVADEVAEAQKAAKLKNAQGEHEARIAPVVGVSSSGARIVRVSRMGWTTHPDDRGALMGRTR